MQAMSDDDELLCLQCGWPFEPGQLPSVVMGVCTDCGNWHPLGAVHLDFCSWGMSHGEPRFLTQQRRAGGLGMN